MTIQSIIRWFELAKPEPTNQDLAKRVGETIEPLYPVSWQALTR